MIGDPNGGDAVAGSPLALDDFDEGGLNRSQNFVGIVLHPARFWEELGEGAIGHVEHGACGGHGEGSHTRGAGINGAEEFHGASRY